MKKEDRKCLYVNKDLQKRIKLFCLTHDIKNMSAWAEPILEAAIKKPSAKERLEKQASETPLEAVVAIDAEVEDKNEPPAEMHDGTKGGNSSGMIGVLD